MHGMAVIPFRVGARDKDELDDFQSSTVIMHINLNRSFKNIFGKTWEIFCFCFLFVLSDRKSIDLQTKVVSR